MERLRIRFLILGYLLSALWMWTISAHVHGTSYRHPTKEQIEYVKALKSKTQHVKRDEPTLPRLTKKDLIFPRRLDFSSCADKKKIAMIEEEVDFAVALLLEAAALPPDHYQFRLFFKPEHARLIRWLFFEKAKLLHPKIGNPTIRVYCDEPEHCQGTENDAFVFSEYKTLTVCDQWFKDKEMKSRDMQCGDPSEKFLDDYYSGGMTIAHEMMHIMFPEVWQIEDLAYEAADCIQLARGELVYTHEDGTKERLKDVDAIRNADSYAYVAMGAYYSRRCGHDIDPFPLDEEHYEYEDDH